MLGLEFGRWRAGVTFEHPGTLVGDEIIAWCAWGQRSEVSPGALIHELNLADQRATRIAPTAKARLIVARLGARPLAADNVSSSHGAK